MVAPLIIGAGIAAGASLVGGAMAARAQSKANKINEDYARNRITYTVRDAKRAGVHPLAALGAPMVSPSAQSVGDYGISSAGRAAGRSISGMRQLTRMEQWINAERLSQATLDTQYKYEQVREKQIQNKMEEAKAMGMPPNLFKEWYDNRGKLGRVWLLDEEAAESGEGFLGKYGTFYGNPQLPSHIYEEMTK